MTCREMEPEIGERGQGAGRTTEAPPGGEESGKEESRSGGGREIMWKPRESSLGY